MSSNTFKKTKKSASAPLVPTILQIVPHLETGGVERGTVDLAIHLKEAGWRPIVVSHGGQWVRQLTRAEVEHITMPVHSKDIFVMRKNITRLEHLIKEKGVHIVHARSRAPAWSAYYAAHRAKVRFVTTFHGTYGLGWFGLKKVYNKIMTRGDLVIANSHFIAEHIQKNYHVDPAKIRVIPRGVDLEKYNPSAVSAERIVRLANLWRVPEDVPVIMQHCRLTRWKGHALLIEAIAKLGRKDIRCLLVSSQPGEASYRRELERLIIKRDLKSVVHIIENCDDLPAAYMLTDVFVSSSIEPEAFGRVSLQAQAMGRPVVATNHGGSKEIVLPDVTGKLVDINPEAMANGLKWALALSKEERERLSTKSIQHVRSEFSNELMFERTMDVYEELLSF